MTPQIVFVVEEIDLFRRVMADTLVAELAANAKTVGARAATILASPLPTR
jgi:hypothetical protein